jgi:hypothetical protein
LEAHTSRIPGLASGGSGGGGLSGGDGGGEGAGEGGVSVDGDEDAGDGGDGGGECAGEGGGGGGGIGGGGGGGGGAGSALHRSPQSVKSCPSRQMCVSPSSLPPSTRTTPASSQIPSFVWSMKFTIQSSNRRLSTHVGGGDSGEGGNGGVKGDGGSEGGEGGEGGGDGGGGLGGGGDGVRGSTTVGKTTISTPCTSTVSPKSNMIHAFSDPAPVHSVLAVPSVQTSRTASLDDAVMYSCDETARSSLRRWRRSSTSPTRDDSTLGFWAMVAESNPPSKNIRVGGR